MHGALHWPFDRVQVHSSAELTSTHTIRLQNVPSSQTETLSLFNTDSPLPPQLLASCPACSLCGFGESETLLKVAISPHGSSMLQCKGEILPCLPWPHSHLLGDCDKAWWGTEPGTPASCSHYHTTVQPPLWRTITCS